MTPKLHADRQALTSSTDPVSFASHVPPFFRRGSARLASRQQAGSPRMCPGRNHSAIDLELVGMEEGGERDGGRGRGQEGGWKDAEGYERPNESSTVNWDTPGPKCPSQCARGLEMSAWGPPEASCCVLCRSPYVGLAPPEASCCPVAVLSCSLWWWAVRYTIEAGGRDGGVREGTGGRRGGFTFVTDEGA